MMTASLREGPGRLHIPAWPGLLVAWVVLGAACVKAPTVVLTDQKTALEKQAAGDFHALENDLQEATIAPKGEDISRQALEAENPDMRKSSLGEVVELYSAVRTDAEWLDELLVAGCVGESKDGLLVKMPESSCSEDVDTGQLTRVVERSNLHRRQLWRLVRTRTPEASEDKVRSAWRANHLERVVCGGMIQADNDSWDKKQC